MDGLEKTIKDMLATDNKPKDIAQAIREKMQIDEVVLANMIIGYSNLDTTEADNLAWSLALKIKELIKW